MEKEKKKLQIQLTSLQKLINVHFFFLLCATFLLISCNGYPVFPKKHTALFVFGDSLFDPGNNNYLDTIGRANYWPYGETFFKYPTGRFSDGRLIPDFIAEYANLPFIPPYLFPGNYDITYGVNFASAGAGALVETSQGYVIDLKTQLSYFKNVSKQLGKKLGSDVEARKMISKAVYLIAMGTNDLDAFLANETLQSSYSKDKYIGVVIGNLTDVIKGIYARGGRKFGLLNVGAYGCSPYARGLQPGGACSEETELLSQQFNNVLSKAVGKLKSQLDGFKYSLHDFYTSSSQRIDNPTAYGFKEAKSACCGSGPYRGDSSCGGKRGITEFEVCDNPSEYLFFDNGHSTDKGNQQYAELIWDGNLNITGPYNLKTLFEV